MSLSVVFASIATHSLFFHITLSFIASVKCFVDFSGRVCDRVS